MFAVKTPRGSQSFVRVHSIVFSGALPYRRLELTVTAT
ncbi:hypothetical protein SAMN04489742_1358 [Arthrobacter crystallopoietes]|uniref:Uncharacterized protein n=1 Tax=Crystallibacter crystallopoietes TaxID=37928 RepID=A0A1H1BDG5_9MICC|nr:hypothetical protein SAMN04489742_1358 [Arthrobacter crystallopoietes]